VASDAPTPDGALMGVGFSYLAENYPDAAQVVVVGKSVVSVAAAVYGGVPSCFPTPKSSCSAPSRAIFRTIPTSARPR
jgi:hypothetical protein